MVTQILLIALCTICAIALVFVFLLNMRQFIQERKEWNVERAKLLDRIQASSFNEYKAQERAETHIKPRKTEKDPLLKRLEDEPWA